MNLKADNKFPWTRSTFIKILIFHGKSYLSKKGLKAAAASNTDPARKSTFSSKAGPMSWSPKGSPSFERPAGMEIPGRPARLAGTVSTSFKYITTGSVGLSSSAKAAEGVVGDFVEFPYRYKNSDKPRRSFWSILGFNQADPKNWERILKDCSRCRPVLREHQNLRR